MINVMFADLAHADRVLTRDRLRVLPHILTDNSLKLSITIPIASTLVRNIIC